MSEVQFKIRLPAELKEALEQSAARNSRSITGEIAYRLERSFPLDELVVNQEKMIAAQLKESETTEKIIKDLGHLIVKVIREKSTSDGDELISALTELMDVPKSKRIRTAKK